MRLRTILLAVAGVIVLAVAAVIIVLLNSDFGKYKGLIAQQVEQATGRKLTIGGDLKLSLLPAPALSAKDVAFANAAGGSRPDMAKLGVLSAEVKLLPLLSGTVSVSRLVLENVDLLLETDAKGRPNWVFATAAAGPSPTTVAAPGGGTLQVPNFDNVSLKNIVVTYRDGVSKKTVTASLKELTTTASFAGPMKVTAAADYQGLPITIDATLGALATLMRPGTPYPVDATVSAAGATVKLTGSAADPIRGHGLDFALKVDGADLAVLGALAGAPLPAKPYHLAATISGDADKAVNIKAMQASLGASSLTGEVGIALNGARPRLSGDLTAPLLDLTEFPPAKAPPPRAGDADRMFSDAPLPFDALRAFDADVALHIAVIKTESLTLQNLALQLTLVDQVLQVKPFGVDAGGSRLNAVIGLAARQAPAAVSVELDGKQVDIGKLLQQASGNDLLVAKGDVNVSVQGTGDSLHAIMASLNGQSSLVIGKGTIKSRYADLIGADVFREAFAWAKGKHDTTLNCMVARFDIKNGVATASGLLMDTTEVSILGEGTISLGPERLDLVLKPRPKETSLINLAMPIDVTGTLKHPSVLPDKVAMAKEVAIGVASVANPLIAVGTLVLNNSGGDDKNPCLAALQGKGAKAQDQGGVGGAVNSIGRSFNNLFK